MQHRVQVLTNKSSDVNEGVFDGDDNDQADLDDQMLRHLSAAGTRQLEFA